jgi:glutathione peroxidase
VNTYSFSAKAVDGHEVPLADYSGKVLLIVNVASKCGLTPQYEGLEALHRQFKDSGLQILGFPCNQFGGQEPGTDEEIQDFCSANYSVSFPVFAKIDVNGPEAAPLYEYLRAADEGDFGPDTPGAERMYAHLKNSTPEVLGTDAVKWNFTKFLVGRDGAVIKRYEPVVTPEQIGAELGDLLSA